MIEYKIDTTKDAINFLIRIDQESLEDAMAKGDIEYYNEIIKVVKILKREAETMAKKNSVIWDKKLDKPASKRIGSLDACKYLKLLRNTKSGEGRYEIRTIEEA